MTEQVPGVSPDLHPTLHCFSCFCSSAASSDIFMFLRDSPLRAFGLSPAASAIATPLPVVAVSRAAGDGEGIGSSEPRGGLTIGEAKFVRTLPSDEAEAEAEVNLSVAEG